MAGGAVRICTENDSVTPPTQTCAVILTSECVQDLALLVRGSQEGCSTAFAIAVPLSVDWQQKKKRCVNPGKTSGKRKTYMQEFKLEKMPFFYFYLPFFFWYQGTAVDGKQQGLMAVKQPPVGITDPGAHRSLCYLEIL